MGDNVTAEVEQLRKISGQLHDQSTKFQALVDRLENIKSQYWGCWGSDSFGQNFENGQNGFSPSYDNLHANLTSKVALLQTYSDGLSQAAKNLQGSEQDSATQFR